MRHNESMITLSERAVVELRGLIEQEAKDAALRVWVAGGGCSGLSYGMALDDSPPEELDSVFEQDGIRLIVDPLSLNYMDGATVDYVDESLGGGFKIENPNATSSCGCGSSFKGEGCGGGCGCGGGGCGCGSK
jgi:iron-sulfur cluster assembly protein